LRDGIPQKKTAVNVKDLVLRDIARKIETKAEANIILQELKRLGWVKSCVLTDTAPAQDFTAFLVGFWDWDTSAYVKEKRRKNHGLHEYHCIRQGTIGDSAFKNKRLSQADIPEGSLRALDIGEQA
jgi:hypothetical protein